MAKRKKIRSAIYVSGKPRFPSSIRYYVATYTKDSAIYVSGKWCFRVIPLGEVVEGEVPKRLK